MPMFKRACVVLLLISASACGGNSTPTAPPPTQANITFTASPNPVTATVCSPACAGSTSGNSYQFQVVGTLTIQETAGIGGNVDSITETNFNPQLVYTSADFLQRSGTSHVAAKGMLIFPVNIVYGLVNNPNASRSMVMPWVAQFTDERGNKLSAAVQWVAN